MKCTPSPRLRRLLFLVIGALLCSRHALAQPPASDVRLAGGQFVVNGHPFLVKGVHYGPWRPGTGPNKQYPYPSAKDIAADFTLIRDAGANTVLIYDPPASVLDLAQQHGLKVVYVFALDWWSVGGERHAVVEKEVVERAAQLRTHPALLAYLLGNEVGGDVLQTRGEQPIVDGLKALYTALKNVDPHHPVSHANWPPAKRLDLRFLDFVSFNVYPLWPPEVVALGYEKYIETVLKPIAGSRPLLISEFGANTIDAGDEGQARLLRDSWQAIVRAKAAGGIVFEFADEWWKNYNNPAKAGDWWTRVAAPEDERTKDEDPEENYGLVLADRTPKPAYFAVKQAFASAAIDAHSEARVYGASALSLVVLAAIGTWWWARRTFAKRSVTAS